MVKEKPGRSLEAAFRGDVGNRRLKCRCCDSVG